MLNGEPEYRRRIREHTENKQHAARQKQTEADQNTKVGDIINAVKNIQENLNRDENKKTPKYKSERFWHILEVVGLFAAAAVGVAAICVGNSDANKNYTATREAYLAVQRAFITVTFVTGSDAEWSITPIIKNSGNTPTRDLDLIWATPAGDNFRMMDKSKISGGDSENFAQTMQRLERDERLLDSPMDPDDLFLNSGLGPFMGRIRYPIGPKDVISLPSFGQKEIGIHLQAMLNHQTPSYLYGAIRYRDVFAGSGWHITKFCLNVVSAVFIRGGAGETPVAAPCKHWNCADDECDADEKAYEHERAELPSAP